MNKCFGRHLNISCFQPLKRDDLMLFFVSRDGRWNKCMFWADRKYSAGESVIKMFWMNQQFKMNRAQTEKFLFFLDVFPVLGNVIIIGSATTLKPLQVKSVSGILCRETLCPHASVHVILTWTRSNIHSCSARTPGVTDHDGTPWINSVKGCIFSPTPSFHDDDQKENFDLSFYVFDVPSAFTPPPENLVSNSIKLNWIILY